MYRGINPPTSNLTSTGEARQDIIQHQTLKGGMYSGSKIHGLSPRTDFDFLAHAVASTHMLAHAVASTHMNTNIQHVYLLNKLER